MAAYNRLVAINMQALELCPTKLTVPNKVARFQQRNPILKPRGEKNKINRLPYI